jgi:hypothetical protein
MSLSGKFKMEGRQTEIFSEGLVTLTVLVFIPILTAYGSL